MIEREIIEEDPIIQEYDEDLEIECDSEEIEEDFDPSFVFEDGVGEEE
jgi:hypothetical protein